MNIVTTLADGAFKSTGKKLQERKSQTARFLFCIPFLYPFSEGGWLLRNFLDLFLQQNAVKIELIWAHTIQNFVFIVFYTIEVAIYPG